MECTVDVDEKAAIKKGCSVKLTSEDTDKDVPVKRTPGMLVVDEAAE